MSRVAARIFKTLAGIGFLLSLFVNVAMLLHLALPRPQSWFMLHLGVFVVFFPAILVSQQVAKGVAKKDAWKAMQADSPRWLRTGLNIVFAYAIFNFALFMLNAPHKGSHRPEDIGIQLRGFSGHWMIFYATSYAILDFWLRGESSATKMS